MYLCTYVNTYVHLMYLFLNELHAQSHFVLYLCSPVLFLGFYFMNKIMLINLCEI